MKQLVLEMRLDTKKDSYKTWQFLQEITQSKDHTELKESIEGLETEVSANTVKFNELTNELKQVHEEQAILCGILERQGMMIDHLQDRNDTMMAKDLSNNLIIQGLETEESDDAERLWEQVTDFFKHTMKISKNVALKSVFRCKNAKIPTLSVQLQHVKDKNIIFKHIDNLKGVKITQDQSYFIQDHLTFQKQEEQRRFRAIKKQNNDLPATERRDVTFVKGKLYLDNVQYRKKISCPLPMDFV